MIEIKIAGCQTKAHFEHLGKLIELSLKNDCPFGDGCTIDVPCNEDGDFCEECAENNTRIVSDQFELEYTFGGWKIEK